MTFKTRWIIICLLSAAVLIAVVKSGCNRDEARQSKAVAPINSQADDGSKLGQFQFVGMGSCSTSGCHGDPYKRDGSHESAEFSFWFQHDPHADALISIEGTKGQGIIDRLMMAAPETNRAEVTAGCLRCHSAVDAEAPVATVSLASSAGIDCESCHGAASGWVDAHHRPMWKTVADEQKVALGFRDLKRPMLLAQTCTPCHVGSKDRQINHELLASGHPYLRFELRASLETLPQHWNDEKIRDVARNVAARRWQHGQLTAAIATLEVLESRAKSSATAAAPAWPEFSEYDCFGCHHHLRMNDFGGRHSVRKDVRDVVSWGRRFLPVIELLAGHDPAAQDLRPTLQSLRQAMQEQWVPDQAEIGRQAAVARSRIQRIRFEERFEQATIGVEGATELISEMWTDIETKPLNWNQIAEIYLAALAIDQDHHDGVRRTGTSTTASDREITQMIERLQNSLDFPVGYSSPKSFDLLEGVSNGKSTSGEITKGLLEMLRKRAALSVPELGGRN